MEDCRRHQQCQGSVGITSVAVYEPYQKALDDELREGFSSRQGFLYDLLRYHLGWTDEQGRETQQPLPLHLQPILALFSAEAWSGDYHAALSVAAAVELVYNFTLVHGDVQAGRMEPGDRPSIWWVWGPAQAINAGDGLHAMGRATIMRLARRGAPPDRVLQAVEALDQACLALCEGQYMDLSFQDQLMVTSSDYFDMVRRKTGALCGCAGGLGAIAAGADDKARRRFQEAGCSLGMAWQISQDILDLWGRHGDGATASNALNKKKSLPLIYALENAPTSVKRELGNIYMKRVLEPADTSRIVAVLDQVEARQHAESQARQLGDEAMSRFQEAGVPAERMAGLERLHGWALSGSP